MRATITSLFALSLTLVLWVATAEATTVAHVYWANGNEAIGEATLSGSANNADFITNGDVTAGTIAVSRKYIYWTNYDGASIGRATLDGHDVNEHFISGASDPCGVAIYAGHLYWANQQSGTIGRATVAGRSVDQSFIKGASQPCGITASANLLYWDNSTSNSVARATIKGTHVRENFVTGADEPYSGVAVNTKYIYWDNLGGSSIGRADINGTHAEQNWLPESRVTDPYGLTITTKYIYWDTDINTIGRANLNGTHANASFILGATNASGIGIGPASTTVRLSRPKQPSKVGKRVTYTATISPLPDGGTVRFTSDGKAIHGCGAVKVSLTTGKASCRATYRSAGKQTVKANYAGDSDFDGSKSPAIKETVKR